MKLEFEKFLLFWFVNLLYDGGIIFDCAQSKFHLVKHLLLTQFSYLCRSNLSQLPLETFLLFIFTFITTLLHLHAGLHNLWNPYSLAIGDAVIELLPCLYWGCRIQKKWENSNTHIE